VRLKVDLIVVAGGAGWVRVVKNATKTIPIVMVGVGFDPGELGLVKTLARPGGNITGLTSLSRELGGKRLVLFKEAVPNSLVSRFSTIPSSPALHAKGWEMRNAESLTGYLPR
jgi:putative ABC transport system substrate-binding protein